ncbi:PH domain-containing protein [Brachybacterium sp. JHP9]|uniref:PH domain-containing protein n=1 Tax=Brachybacterium equifaecis TaxID=2910770 RepID=A0ABT0QW00_9MICO|nr:PH domain-containing protein [Brachybacterium equifaecis]
MSDQHVHGPRRTHPLTPLLTGWKVLAGVVAVLLAQNISALVDEFTWRRALLGGGILLGIALLAVVLSAVSWWRTTYEISEDGVTLRSGLLTLTRRVAPRERIESVSVERPLLARLAGLAKVRVEMAGGGESHLDLAYVTARDAEEIRTRILRVAAEIPQDAPAPGESAEAPVGPTGAAAGGPAPAPSGIGASAPAEHPEAALAAEHPESAFAAGHPEAALAADRRSDRLRAALHDGVTGGELIAQIPTSRLIRSLLRDVSLLVGAVFAVLWAAFSIGLLLTVEGYGFASLAVALPIALGLVRSAFSRVESGWGFVSRNTDTGLRMRRGLLNTRTDNIGSGRVQDITLHRPLLWRGPGWTRAAVTVAGIDATDDAKATSVLPVGTREELARTFGHLVPGLGTEDDSSLIEHLLTAPAAELGGTGPRSRLYFVGRRTRRVLVLPGAIAVRSGILTKRVQIVPRERIQGLSLAQGPIARRVGSATLSVGIAGSSAELHDLPLADALALQETLAADARSGRRYDRERTWPQPPLAGRPALAAAAR